MSGDDALWVDLMSAMSSVLGTDDEAIDIATDLLAAIQPHVERADGDKALVTRSWLLVVPMRPTLTNEVQR